MDPSFACFKIIFTSSKDKFAQIPGEVTAVLLKSIHRYFVKSSALFVGLGLYVFVVYLLGPGSLFTKPMDVLVQTLTCCLTAPSHYLKQYWPIIIKVQWHSSDRNFTLDHQSLIRKTSLKIAYLKFPSNIPGSNEFTRYSPKREKGESKRGKPSGIS